MGAKDRNRQYVLDKAKQLFTERGVTGVSMTDVALFADFGVASVYRYFGGKNALVTECAVALWEDKLDRMRVLYDENFDKTGYEQLAFLTRNFTYTVVSDKNFTHFLFTLDAFLISEKITFKDRDKYDDIMLEIYSMFETAYKKGLSDGSVRNVGSFEDFYFAATQSLISLTQKLTMRGNIVSKDKSVDSKIELLINMFTDYVKNK